MDREGQTDIHRAMQTKRLFDYREVHYTMLCFSIYDMQRLLSKNMICDIASDVRGVYRI
jgi:hypothetical protein